MIIDEGGRRRWRVLAAAILAAAIAAAVFPAGCGDRRGPIVIRDGVLVLENQTAREWRNVRVTINDHFTGGVAKLLPGGLMTAPLRNFQSGFGHHFEPWRMSVQKVRVTATVAGGDAVEIAWPE